MNILIVEDNPSSSFLMREICVNIFGDVEINAVNSARLATDLADQMKFYIMLVDQNLVGEMKGTDFLSKIKHKDWFKSCWKFMVSGDPIVEGMGELFDYHPGKDLIKLKHQLCQVSPKSLNK